MIQTFIDKVKAKNPILVFLAETKAEVMGEVVA